MGKSRNSDVSMRSDVRMKDEYTRMIGSVLKAVGVGLDRLEGDRISALNALISLEAKKRGRVKCLLWEKRAAVLALKKIDLFFGALGTSLFQIMDVLQYNEALDELIVKNIQDAVSVWASLERTSD